MFGIALFHAEVPAKNPEFSELGNAFIFLLTELAHLIRAILLSLLINTADIHVFHKGTNLLRKTLRIYACLKINQRGLSVDLHDPVAGPAPNEPDAGHGSTE